MPDRACTSCDSSPAKAVSATGLAVSGSVGRACGGREASAVARAGRLPLLRRLSQLAMLAGLGQWSFYGIFRCPFIVPYVSCQNCPVLTCHGRILSLFWGAWLLLPVSALLVGRAYCGWACPGGLVSQMLGKLAPVKARVRNAFTRIAPLGAYLALIGCLYVWFAMGQPRGNIPIRTGEFFGAVSLTFEHAGLLWLVRTGIVLTLVALGLGVANFWCRFACPTGGAFEIVKRFSLFKVYKTEACNGCDKCLKVCEMGTRPEETACTNCGDCLDSCPQGAIGFGRKPS
ncbi:4Fe-4S binding protein [Fundidesulfovibrio terrae]|uniref:4Fe-4S binding protein n=1 Tax=Fundidesulfovibrio terrae TaxID=2922866 RepID=UPI001FAE9B18|nr:4Fe-4S binding protein [Fundidesulfovibrio terrae]